MTIFTKVEAEDMRKGLELTSEQMDMIYQKISQGATLDELLAASCVVDPIVKSKMMTRVGVCCLTSLLGAYAGISYGGLTNVCVAFLIGIGAGNKVRDCFSSRESEEKLVQLGKDLCVARLRP